MPRGSINTPLSGLSHEQFIVYGQMVFLRMIQYMNNYFYKQMKCNIIKSS